MNMLYLSVLWGLGGFLALDRSEFPSQGTLFEHQKWSAWIGLSAATLVHLAGIVVGRSGPLQAAGWLIYILIEALVLLGIFFFFRRVLGISPSLLGFSSNRLSLRLIVGLRWIVGYFLVGNGFFYLSLVFLERGRLLESRQRAAGSTGEMVLGLFEREWGAGFLWLPILFLVLLGPVLEEVLFRGLLYGPTRRRAGPVFAALITSFLFTLGHGAFHLDYFLFGLLFAYLYESTQSLFPGILFHVLINLRTVLRYFDPSGAIAAEDLKTEAGWMTILLGGLLLSIEVVHHRMLKRGMILKSPVSA